MLLFATLQYPNNVLELLATHSFNNFIKKENDEKTEEKVCFPFAWHSRKMDNLSQSLYTSPAVGPFYDTEADILGSCAV